MTSRAWMACGSLLLAVSAAHADLVQVQMVPADLDGRAQIEVFDFELRGPGLT
jgi:hypothetical protein